MIGKRCIPYNAGGMMAGLILMAALILFGAAGSEASNPDIFAVKGFLFDPGGAPSNVANPYFAGVRPETDGVHFDIGIWNLSGNSVYSQRYNGNGCMPMADYSTGSAVFFNDLVYVFVPTFYNSGGGPVMNYVWYSTINPSNWQEVSNGLVLAYSYEVITSGTKNGIGAAVANNAIYLFIMGDGGYLNVVSSSDGQNFSLINTGGTTPPYPVVHDAITFSDPTSGSTKILVVMSGVNSNNTPGMPYVTVFDPATNSFGNWIALPQSFNGSTQHASAYFGSFYGTLNQSAGSCPHSTWGSNSPTAYLHVFATFQSGADQMAHWYLDPASGNWMLDGTGCAAWPNSVWWVANCANNVYTPIAIAPTYATNTSSTACGTQAPCLSQTAWMMSCGFTWTFGANPYWSFGSDYWVPSVEWNVTPPGSYTYNTVNTGNPQDPSLDPSNFKSVQQLWRIAGVIYGSAPFPLDPSWQGPDDWAGISNVTIGQSSTTESSVSNTYSTSFSMGLQTTCSAPFVKNESGLTADTGRSTTTGSGQSFEIDLAWTVGTTSQVQATLGQLGYTFYQAPEVTPNAYVATSTRNPGINGTPMGYTQVALQFTGQNQYMSAFPLQTPGGGSLDQTFGLMNGLQPIPLSTNIPGWMISSGMQDWSDTASGNWKVIGGNGQNNDFQINEITMGPAVSEQFVGEKTTMSSWSNDFSTDVSDSLRIGTKKNNVTTSFDMSQGWSTDGENSSTLDQSLEADYSVPETTGNYCNIQIQPYLLQATTTNAPWVPKGYLGPLPWAVTWDVTYAQTCSSAQKASSGSGTIYAKAPMPEGAYGRITGSVSSNGIYPKGDDIFMINGGKLSYTNALKQLVPIGMTASDFDPYRGVTITINDYKLYANASTGIWRRSGSARWPGNVWTFIPRTGEQVAGEQIFLELDFGTMMWNMTASRIELGDNFAELKKTAVVVLDINNRYVLTTRIVHQMAYEWKTDLSSLDQPMKVYMIQVNSGFDGTGKVKLSGSLTDQVKSAGDTSVVLNGSKKDYRVMNASGFINAVKNKLSFTYHDSTGNLMVNFGSGDWTSDADTKVFSLPYPMYHGEAELKIRVGGKDYFKSFVRPDSYMVELIYGTM